MKKYLIVGLGNPGLKYENTRHNIGFQILDEFADQNSEIFESDKLAEVCKINIKGRQFICIKPQTFMNLSGKAVRYWMQKENVDLDHLLIITDDINIDFGVIRIKGKGSDGGHNGLKNIQDILNTTKYPRFRFGVGSEFSKGQQIDHVLGEWTAEEQKVLDTLKTTSIEAIKSFGLTGINQTMNQFNGKISFGNAS
jgi:PTH1 family peptidyl-tRNA hydrolase